MHSPRDKNMGINNGQSSRPTVESSEQASRGHKGLAEAKRGVTCIFT